MQARGPKAAYLLIILGLLLAACSGGGTGGEPFLLIVPPEQPVASDKLLVLTITPSGQPDGEVLHFQVSNSDKDELSFSLNIAELEARELGQVDLHLLVYPGDGSLNSPCFEGPEPCSGIAAIPDMAYRVAIDPDSSSRQLQMAERSVDEISALTGRILFQHEEPPLDADSDGFLPPVDCDDNNALVNPAASEDCGDLIDNDCDGLIDLADSNDCVLVCQDNDGDNFRVGLECPGGETLDCNDSNKYIYPGAAESCNELDDDCDGSKDEDFLNKGLSCSAGVGACQQSGTYVCRADGLGTICDAVPGTPQSEICGNGIDEDCDGTPDDGCGGGGLLAYYPFDGNPNDASGNGYHATLKPNPPADAPLLASGAIGQAYEFDGDNDHIQLPALVQNAVDFTFAAWVFWHGPVSSDSERIFDFNDGSSTPSTTGHYMYLSPRGSNGLYIFRITLTGYQDNNDQELNAAAPLPTNSWVHVAVTLDGNSGTLYQDGQVVDTNGSMTFNPQDLGTVNHWFGRSAWAVDNYLDGLIDEVYIYDRALSAQEIATIYQSTIPDADSDGYKIPEDCDDGNPDINPGVLEKCDDSVDNNCNTQTDEGCGLSLLLCKQASGPISIDGQLSEAAWNAAKSVNFHNPGRSDNRVNVKTLWDSTAIYFFYQVMDENLEAQNVPGDLWEDDGTEVFLDTGHEESQTRDSNDFQAIVNMNNFIDTNPAFNVQVATVLTPIGYNTELAIPWLEMNALSPFEGLLMGLLFANNDPDSGSYSSYDWMNIADLPDDSYWQPDLWGDIQLIQ